MAFPFPPFIDVNKERGVMAPEANLFPLLEFEC
jgi:hypothetical protein